MSSLPTQDMALHEKKLARSAPKKLTLRANFSWMFVSNIVYAASQWGMIVILARLGSPEIVGRFALGLAVTAPVIEFSNLRLRQIQATDARRQFQFGEYLALRMITAGLAFLMILAIAWTIQDSLETKIVIMIVASAKTFESFSDIFYGAMQSKERMDRIAKSMLIKGPLSLIALGFGTFLTKSLIWGTVGLAGAWAATFLFYDLPSLRKIVKEVELEKNLSPCWNYKNLANLAWLAFPMGISTLLMSLNANIPRYFVEHNLGKIELGIFVAIAYFHRAGTTFVDALGESAIPRLSQYYAGNDTHAFRKLMLGLLAIGFALGLSGVLIASLLGEKLLVIFYGPQYARQVVFITIMVASGVAYVTTFLLYMLTVTRKLVAQTFLYVLSTLSLIIACYLLIPVQGLQGAALALVIARSVNFAGCLIVVGYIFLLSDQRNDRNNLHQP